MRIPGRRPRGVCPSRGTSRQETRNLRLASLAVLPLALGFAAASHAPAQPAHRIADLNTGGITPAPYDLTTAGNRLFFIADDGPHGAELWTSDGTGAGTARIPGTSGATQIMRAGTRVFFLRGFDLWVSDGTTGGTSFVAGLAGAPQESADLSGTLYFSLGNPLGAELWRSDGTPGGTLRVKEPDPGDRPRSVKGIVTGNGRLFFVATKNGIDALWTTDGTPAGTSAVMASPVRVVLSAPPGLGVLGNVVVFCGEDLDHGSEPWVSDGTDAGTVLLKEIGPGPFYSSSPNEFVRSGARLFFRVLWQIFSTDGTPDGTSFFTTVPLDLTGGTTVDDLTDVGGRLCFRSTVPSRVWAAGSPDSTVLYEGRAENLTAVGSRLFFTAGNALLASDLTAVGTRVVRSFGSGATSLAVLGDSVFFFAADRNTPVQLWKSDGSATGTEAVTTFFRPGPLGSNPRGFLELGGEVFFLASSEGAGTDLWRTDGTESGTKRAVDPTYDFYSLPVATSRRLFWLEGFGGGPNCCPPPWLVASDGTQAGTAPVPVAADPVPSWSAGPLVTSGEQVFLFGWQGTAPSLWRTDGSAGGTRLLGRLPDGTAAFGPLVAFDGGAAFLARSSAGTELWFSDGTASGTGPVKSLSSRTPPTCWTPPRRLGRVFLFLADDGSKGCNVWRSDGTAAGTMPLGDVNGGMFLGSARGVLVFANGAQLWRTDGTAAGTFLLTPFPVAALGLGQGTREGVYFTIQTSGIVNPMQQLWITDGTSAGTVFLHDFRANGESSIISGVDAANGRVLATVVEDATGARILWTSDGTPAGTVLVQKDVGASGAFPYRDGTLFAGTDPWAGTELWLMDGAAFAASVPPTSLSLVAPCRILDTRLPNGFLGGPALLANAPRVFPVGGVCGVPWTARALAANVTVTGATSDGLLKIHPSDIGEPEASTINFRAGQTRANNATLALSGDGEMTVRYETASGAGTVHVIVDVVGWYE